MIENPFITAITLQGSVLTQLNGCKNFQRVLQEAIDHYQGIVKRAGADSFLRSFDGRDDYITFGNLLRRAATLAGLSPYANSPSNTSQFWAREYGSGLPIRSDIPYRSTEVFEKLTYGEPFSTAVIVTHPFEVLEEVAHYLLERPELLTAPRIGLFQDDWPLKPSIANQLSLSIYSIAGTLNGFEVVADSYFIMGGCVGCCLAKTIGDLLSFLVKTNRQQCRIIIPLELCEGDLIAWAQKEPRYGRIFGTQPVYSLMERGERLARDFFGYSMDGKEYEYRFDEKNSSPDKICVDHTRGSVDIRIEFLSTCW